MRVKEQILIIKVRYDSDYDRPPHTWDWSSLLGSDHDIEVVNHGAEEETKA